MVLPLVVPTKGVTLSPLQTATFGDFTGGIDWMRGGSLDPKSTDSMLNVDPLPKGGFMSRRGVTPWTTNPTLAFPAYSLSKYENNVSMLLIGDTNGNLYRVLEGPNPPIQLAMPPMNPFRGVQANYRWYFQDGINYARFYAWDADSDRLGMLNVLYNGTGTDGERTPLAAQGSMPVGKYLAFYHQRVFVFSTNEGGIPHPNRVRWSYPIINGLGAEDFRSDTWVDIEDGADGDQITGAIAHGPSLFVFKRNSIFHIEGFDETNFTFLPLNFSAGAVGPDAMVNTQDGIFFWDATRGLCQVQHTAVGSEELYDVINVSDQLSNALRDGTIPSARLSEVTIAMGLGETRVHCSVPWFDGTKHTLVYDRTLKCWRHWDLNLGPMLLYRPTKGRSALLAGNHNPTYGNRVLEVGGSEQALDRFGPSPVDWVPFQSYYSTAWLGLETPFAAKMIFLLEAIVGGAGDLLVEVGRDWEPTNLSGTLMLHMPGPEPLGPEVPPILPLDVGTLATQNMEVLSPGSPPVALDCDPTLIGYALDGPMLRGHRVTAQMPRCHFRSVQLTFWGPATGSPWQVLAFGLKYFAQTRTT